MTHTDFHVMAKSTGAKCNLDCAYCLFLKKEQLYPESSFRMSDAVMHSCVRQTIQAKQAAIAWQGGEPTLMGLDLFRRAMAVERKYLEPGRTIENTIQTNGILIDEEWCRILHDHSFLVGMCCEELRVVMHNLSGRSGMAYLQELRAKNVSED